jgi:UDP-glucose:(heptosyl)LPS alpha-1,3-glucosyltransferase
MRIALICRPFTFHGGVETATAGLIGELLRQGHQVDLVSTRGQADIPGARVHRLPVPRQPSLMRLIWFAVAAPAAARRSGADIVQSHERTLGQDVYRAGEGTHRGYLEAMGRPWARVSPYHQSVCALEKRVFSPRNSRHIVAISRLGKGEIEGRYRVRPERVTVVYNGVDLERFHPAKRESHGQRLRGELGMSREEWVVLFVGSGFERKGLGPLIEGIARLSDRRSRLVVAGKGEEERYRALAARLGLDYRVLWLGPRENVEGLYAIADAVALPARYEPFGNVHLEALASGLPVLTSRRAGGSELISPGENGWIVEEPEPDAIAQGLEALRQTDPRRLAHAARSSAEPFTHAAQVGALGEIWRQLKR